MAKTTDIPSFGPLSGLKVFSTGSNLAQPWAAEVMAQYGATVIQTEYNKESMRFHPTGFVANNRNKLNLALNINSEEGKEVFSRMIKWCDIWMEASKAGTYAKWGITDEYVWSINPKCVIVHVTGFGLYGDPNLLSRGSTDIVGQAYSGYMQLQGPAEVPYKNSPFTCDYVCALYAAVSSLSAYIKAQKTGKGESIDLAQYEAMLQLQSSDPMDYFNFGKEPQRWGNSTAYAMGCGVYECKDGKFCFISAAGGVSVVEKMLKVVGLDNDPTIPKGLPMIPRAMTGPAEKFEAAVEAYCKTKTAAEVDAEMASLSIPSSLIMTYPEIEKSEHYKMRENIVEWYDPSAGKDMKGFNIVPKFKNNPTQIWRGSPVWGMDNDDLMSEFGFSEDEIKAMYEKGVLRKEKEKEA